MELQEPNCYNHCNSCWTCPNAQSTDLPASLNYFKFLQCALHDSSKRHSVPLLFCLPFFQICSTILDFSVPSSSSPSIMVLASFCYSECIRHFFISSYSSLSPEMHLSLTITIDHFCYTLGTGCFCRISALCSYCFFIFQRPPSTVHMKLQISTLAKFNRIYVPFFFTVINDLK